MDIAPRRVEHQHTDKGYVPVYTTTVVAQPWDRYDADDHATWGTLYRRQRELLVGRACDAFLQAQDTMGMSPQAIPKFDQLNTVLAATTGWTLVGVEGLLPELDFFDHLANRRFPVTWWIRRPGQIDYIAEPDLFHDLFGHVPLLMNPRFADYMQAYGRGGVKAHAIGPQALQHLTRLYWYTVEFGLIDTPAGLRIYGAGIVSSKGESLYALESDHPIGSASIYSGSCARVTASIPIKKPTSSSTASRNSCKQPHRISLRSTQRWPTKRICRPGECSRTIVCSNAAAEKAGTTTATCKKRAMSMSTVGCGHRHRMHHR